MNVNKPLTRKKIRFSKARHPCRGGSMIPPEDQPNNQPNSIEQLKYRVKAGAFLTLAGGFGLFGGFAFALATAKKADPKAFDQGLVSKQLINEPHSS